MPPNSLRGLHELVQDCDAELDRLGHLPVTDEALRLIAEVTETRKRAIVLLRAAEQRSRSPRRQFVTRVIREIGRRPSLARQTRSGRRTTAARGAAFAASSSSSGSDSSGDSPPGDSGRRVERAAGRAPQAVGAA